MAILDNDTQVSVLVEGLDHAEGIAWGLDGYAYAGGASPYSTHAPMLGRGCTESPQFMSISDGSWLGT